MIKELKQFFGFESVEEKAKRYNDLCKSFEEVSTNIDELAKEYFIEKSLYESRMKDQDNYSIQDRIENKFQVFISEHKGRIRKAKKEYSSVKKEKSKLEQQELIQKSLSYQNIKKAYQDGIISLDSFNTVIKSITKDKKTRYADFLLFNEKGEILLQQKPQWSDHNPNKWEIPGGHVDPGESFEQAAIRELREESGYNVEECENVGSYENKDVHIEYFQGFINTDENPMLLDYKESRDYRWIELKEIFEYPMVFNMRENIIKILGLKDQPNKTVIRKAILMGLIPIEKIKNMADKCIDPDIEKAKAQIGEIRQWADGSYKKIAIGEWVEVTEGKEKKVAGSGVVKKIKEQYDINAQEFSKIKSDFKKSLETKFPKGTIQYKVFFQRAWSQEVNTNSFIEKIRQQQTDLNDEIIEISNKVKSDKKLKREELKGKKEFDFEDLSEQLRELDKLFTGVINKIPRTANAADVMPTVSVDDYYLDTDATFKSVEEYKHNINDGVYKDNVAAKWKEMIESGKYEFTQSPKSSSQYLIDRKRGDVYRIADHWGRCASCFWSETFEGGSYGIGCCNVSDFKRKKSGGYFNPQFRVKLVEAAEIVLPKLTDLVKENKDFYLTDKAKDRVVNYSNKIFKDYLKFSALLCEDELKVLRNKYVDLFDENYIKKSETGLLKKAILQGIVPLDMIEKAWKKHPIGTTITRKDGQKYTKVSETGNSDQDWKLASKTKTKSGKPESKGNSEAKIETDTNPQPTIKELKKHAQNASEQELENAIKQSSDSEVRKVANQEIERRNKEEKPQEEEKKPAIAEKKKEDKPIKKSYESWL
jgi:mutator protein MutT